jgi:hypothetical protein
MKHIFLIFTAILGFIVLFIYLHECSKNNSNKINKDPIIEIFLNSSTTIGGFAFLFSPFIPSLKDVIETDLFVIIGGVTIIISSTENLKKILNSAYSNDLNNKD